MSIPLDTETVISRITKATTAAELVELEQDIRRANVPEGVKDSWSGLVARWGSLQVEEYRHLLNERAQAWRDEVQRRRLLRQREQEMLDAEDDGWTEEELEAMGLTMADLDDDEEEDPEVILAQEDWLKHVRNLNVSGLEELRKMIHGMGMTIEQFKALPIYRNSIRDTPWLRDL